MLKMLIYILEYTPHLSYTNKGNKYYYPHFKDEELILKRVQIILPKLKHHKWQS